MLLANIVVTATIILCLFLGMLSLWNGLKRGWVILGFGLFALFMKVMVVLQ